MAKNIELHPGASADFSAGSVYFVGTATVILRYAGFTILTDPNFLHAGDHVHLGYGLTSERLTDPAMNIEDLPPLDFCVLSHYHGDHFDQVVEEKLRKDLPIITTEHAAAELEGKGFSAAVALDTWDAVIVRKGDAGVRVTSMPGKHGPAIADLLLPPVMGSMLEFQPAPGQTALRLYITGDTLVHDDLYEIPRRFPDIDLALFHLGGTRIMGILLTMDAGQGVEAIRITNPRKVIPVHYNDYEVFKSPLEDFKKEVGKAGLEDRIIYLGHGDTYEFEVPASRLLPAPAHLSRARPAGAFSGKRRGSRAARQGGVTRPANGRAALALLGGACLGAALMYLSRTKTDA